MSHYHVVGHTVQPRVSFLSRLDAGLRLKGHPCGHNVKHAMELGIPGSSLFHYKDTTSCWKEQYQEDAEWPEISLHTARENGLAYPRKNTTRQTPACHPKCWK